MTRPVVTFLTDFGLEDTFVGQMKGVVLSRRPDATLVDLTHHVPPQSVIAGAYHLSASWRWFPAGTVHVAVVDPGVGSERRAIGVRFEDHTFLVPDNGLLSVALGPRAPDLAVGLYYQSQAASSTFHGRDVFARAAGEIVAGASLQSLGRLVDANQLIRLDVPEPVLEAGAIYGVIVLIDHFGNAISNVTRDLLGDDPARWTVECGSFTAESLSTTYSDARVGDPVALVSSMDTVELAVRDGSAARRYDLERGMGIILRQSRHS
jgi:S-adenosyl-L-methionine hydrolase (adenosine-forming)